MMSASFYNGLGALSQGAAGLGGLGQPAYGYQLAQQSYEQSLYGRYYEEARRRLILGYDDETIEKPKTILDELQAEVDEWLKDTL